MRDAVRRQPEQPDAAPRRHGGGGAEVDQFGLAYSHDMNMRPDLVTGRGGAANPLSGPW